MAPRLLFQALIFVCITVLAAILGPFGSYEHGVFLDRLVYWTVLNAVSFAIALSLIHITRSAAPKLHGFWREAILCALLTLFFTPFLQYWTVWYFDHLNAENPDLISMGTAVFSVAVCISILRHGIPYSFAQKTEKTEPPLENEEYLPKLLERLEPQQRSPIQRVSVDGHKVLVVMQNGEQELRMRFSDAVAELEGVPGFATHRSHWVAEYAIKAVATNDKGRPELHLHNGDIVPVSRKHEQNLEDRGLVA
ncbi:MAG: LytTR family transcriptional regulator [Rhodobacteraceae bacterium]|nr:LytTR family transcriptional regulator [Paracoccaceae bacterium]